MRRFVPVVLTLSIVLSGCKAKEAMEQAKIASELAKSGSTTKLMKDVAEDSYDAPADGKLTDGQIQMYLKVREKEKAIAEVAKQQLKEHGEKAKQAGDKSIAGMMEGLKGLGSAADFLTADIRAAKDLGYNTQEYLWVKTQILAASSADMTSKMTEVMNAQMEASYAQMKKAYDEAKDEPTKAMYKQSIDAYEQQKKEAAANKEPEDPALAHNRQLLAKYESTLTAFASEMAKYEDKPGEVKKATEQWEKDIEKAKADAQKAQQ